MLIQSQLKGKAIFIFRLKPTPGLLNGFMMTGFLSLFFSVLSPGLFFPLVWLGFIFLLEPVNYRLKIDSLLADMGKKYGNRIMSWLLAGFAAGLLWELLNHWAGSHWEYSLPYLNFCKILQMPVLGFGGFLPFALEVFAMYSLLDFFRKRMFGRRILKAVLVILILAFNALAFHLVDLFTLVP